MDIETSLYELVLLHQEGNRDASLAIINKFKPLIKKLSKKLNYEEAETDLVILFIQLLGTIDINKFDESHEGALVKYLFNFLKHRSIDLFRKYVLKPTEELELNLDILKIEVDMDTHIFVKELFDMDILTAQQKLILKHSYLSEYSDSEIAKSLNISRQAVNKTKRRGIEALRNYLYVMDNAKG
ncbi:RNA polymerase sigma factor [Clostridium sp. UBA4548]|uniref:RNA polymerase sigma factor n=1 Tax=Clostridium sp. UBA4548 TaxID=1946361 RepID=UPI0025C3AC0B|nr:sigma-70 family RNA polymerase sigma factor [Clostridium sp. UBA4548]